MLVELAVDADAAVAAVMVNISGNAKVVVAVELVPHDANDVVVEAISLEHICPLFDAHAKPLQTPISNATKRVAEEEKRSSRRTTSHRRLAQARRVLKRKRLNVRHRALQSTGRSLHGTRRLIPRRTREARRIESQAEERRRRGARGHRRPAVEITFERRRAETGLALPGARAGRACEPWQVAGAWGRPGGG
jgi:hypothetical protein